MTWGFTSRKDQDGPTESSTEDAKQQQLSPSKRNKRRIGGGRRRGDLDGSGDNNNNAAATARGVDSGGNQERTNGKKKMGPLNFGRHKEQQSSANSSSNEQALRSSRMMNQQQQQQDINVDTSDDGQEIEILLDSPTKSHQQHHSRRSMSNHKGHRSNPPDSARPSHEHFNNQLLASGMDANNAKVSVVSLEKDILVKRTKIYRAQFSVFFPITTTRGGSEAAASSRGPRKHRVPLGGRLPRKHDMSYQDVLEMLQNADPVDETSSVRAELKKTTTEMDALEEDKTNLKVRWKALNQQQKSTAGANAGGEQQLNMQLPATMSSGLGVDGGVDWDIHRLLKSQRKIGLQERLELERTRGRCITVCLQNPRAEDSFLNKCCGAKQPLPPKSVIHGGVATTTMDPNNCRSGGAGASIRHLALLPKGSSFFVSRDNGKSYSWGQLPPRILQRMKNQGLDPVTHCGDLVYLSTGPNGYYYAEFRSGECWWGCAGEDKEFYEILQQWEVYRVVFGSTVTHTTATGKDIISNSWIILARDGRAAWKNLPLRLHHTLERRLANSAAPAEVALGSGDSYYVRFLDGTADYCLSAEMASACERIHSKGGSITDMAMNPEVSHEFMVRHTELPPR